MRIHALLLPAALLLCAGPLAAQPPAAPAPPPCDPDDGYICGVQAPEDLVAMGDEWVVASAFAGTGGVTLIRVADREVLNVYPSQYLSFNHDDETYPDCPGPPDADAFTTHGVYVAPGDAFPHKLFVVGHGARESIEIFDVMAYPDNPIVVWVGCVVAPDPIGLNSVRGLPDGGFLTTNFNPRNTPMQTMMDGTQNGELWEWHTDTGWEIVPGSEASGANGVELSDDGNTMYVAAWGSQSFFTLTRGEDPPVREEIDLGFRIDNIHWARDGTLLTAGQVGQDWQIAKIDPDTLEVEQIYSQLDMPGFGGGTVALEIGNEYWVGSYRGDRIAVIPMP